jgi:hypothetical protein
MARPIKETPVLTGEDARRFEQRMKDHKPLPKKEVERMEKSYQLFKQNAKFPT